MKPAAIILSALWLGWSSLPVGATDLTKIDRSIVKEPQYKTEPHYALVVLGPKAEQRVWLVVDGEVLYVDRNGNGDLTEANERVALKSKRTYEEPGVYIGRSFFDIGEVADWRLSLDFWVRDKNYVPKANAQRFLLNAAEWMTVEGYDKKLLKDHQENGWEFATLRRSHRKTRFGSSEEHTVTFCRRPQDAQVWHFDGPLTFAHRRKGDSLVRGCDNNFQVVIGTPGLPPRTSDERVFVSLATSEVPAKVHPVADFEFAHHDATRPPTKLQVVLNKRC
jgi:hypothetical protein